MPSKIRLKLGAIEVEYEGEEQFLKEELPNLLRAIVELQKAAQDSMPKSANVTGSADIQGGGAKIQLATNSIASKLGVQSGSDLLVAACAHLTFVKGNASSSRKDILQEAATATAYYNESVRKNATNYLSTLVKADKLNEITPGVFALTATAIEEIKAKVGIDG